MTDVGFVTRSITLTCLDVGFHSLHFARRTINCVLRMVDKFMVFIDNEGKALLPQLELIEIGFQSFIRNIQTKHTKIGSPCINKFLSDRNDPLTI
ncbi:Uncharacterised protein [Streptococcus pneumoniae]|nr:Uncharacterised protein [Streptococcus pneumoniae]